MNAATQLVFGGEFDVAAPLLLPTAVASGSWNATIQVGLAASSGTGFYWSGRYSTASYWAPRYWQTQAEFDVSVTAGLSGDISCTLSAAASLALDFVTSSTVSADAQAQIVAMPVLDEVLTNLNRTQLLPPHRFNRRSGFIHLLVEDEEVEATPEELPQAIVRIARKAAAKAQATGEAKTPVIKIEGEATREEKRDIRKKFRAEFNRDEAILVAKEKLRADQERQEEEELMWLI
jgi:hypothetical protein